MRMRWWLILGAAVAGVAGAQAQEFAGSEALGRKLAITVCSACHAVEKGAHDVASSGPPAFQAVADDPAMTELALRVFLRTPHQDMPDLILTDDETDGIIAYIHGLKGGR